MSTTNNPTIEEIEKLIDAKVSEELEKYQNENEQTLSSVLAKNNMATVFMFAETLRKFSNYLVQENITNFDTLIEFFENNNSLNISNTEDPDVKKFAEAMHKEANIMLIRRLKYEKQKLQAD